VARTEIVSADEKRIVPQTSDKAGREHHSITEVIQLFPAAV
jgi:hypothetical protein